MSTHLGLVIAAAVAFVLAILTVFFGIPHQGAFIAGGLLLWLLASEGHHTH